MKKLLFNLVFEKTITKNEKKYFRNQIFKQFKIISCFISLYVMIPQEKSFCQVSSNYTPPNPVAQQFEKYINYPVDHSTGAANVSVPLYTVKGKSIEVPVGLSYHASGVRIGDVSIPVGLGWTISPGARVTRKILSYPDELYSKAPYQSNYDPIQDLLALENMEYATGAGWPSSNRSTTLDAESDIFTYTTPTGGSGRFTVQWQGNVLVAVPLVLTKDKIKVQMSGGPGSSIDYIEVTDGNGILYRYGMGLSTYSSNTASTTKEYTNVDWTPRVTGWMLTDIVSPDLTDVISLSWTSLQNTTGSGWYRKKVCADNIIVTDKIYYPLPGSGRFGDYQSMGYSHEDFGGPQWADEDYTISVIAGIKCNDVEVKMNYSGGLTLLANMEVFSNSVKQRQVDFQTSSFATGYTRLDAVTFRDKAGQVVNSYSFGYDEQTQLPSEYEWNAGRAQDYWGYFNGYTGNTTLVPNFSYQVDKWYPDDNLAYTINTGANRSSNDNAKAYVLNSVTYPTGGKTTYEYEVNKIKDPATFQAIGSGGLRVKKISHFSSTGQLAESRSYVYGIDECGVGEGLQMRAEMFVNETEPWAYWQSHQQSTFTKFRKRVISCNPVNPMFMSDLAPVYYREVTEYVGDPAGNNIGKTVYRYTAAPLPINSTYFYYTAYTYCDNYYKQPVLTSSTVYKNSGGTYSQVRQDSTNYIDYEAQTINSWVVRRLAYITSNQTTVPTTEFEANFNMWFQGALSSVFNYFPVYLKRGIRVPSTQRTTEFSPSGVAIVTEKVFGYANNDYLFPATLTTTNSNGATTITHYTYPKDYNVGTTTPTNNIAQGIKLLQDRNVVAPVIEEYTEVQPGNVIKSGKFTTFKTDKPLPESIYSLNAISSAGNFNPATITSSSYSKSSAYLLRTTVDLYDSYGNIRQVTDKASNITSVILYSYGGKFPVAILKNTTYANLLPYRTDAGINSFAAGYPTNAEVDNFLSGLRSSLPEAYITSYTQDPFLGVTSQTDENGRTTTYVYDAAGRLQLIKDKDGNVVKTFEYKYKQ